MNKAWTDLRIYEGSVGLQKPTSQAGERRVRKIILVSVMKPLTEEQK